MKRFAVTVTYQENPKVALAALLGQLGGNAGLWCGLSFVMMLEALEFLIVALFMVQVSILDDETESHLVIV